MECMRVLGHERKALERGEKVEKMDWRSLRGKSFRGSSHFAAFLTLEIRRRDHHQRADASIGISDRKRKRLPFGL